MKLYYFEYEEYGIFYLVMSDSPEQAIQSVKDYLKKEADEMASIYAGEIYEQLKYTRCVGSRAGAVHNRYEEWKDATIDNLPANYTLRVMEENEVFEGEWS